MRKINLSSHPSNIKVFEAASMDEAIVKADAAIRCEGIQTAVWHTEAVILNWDQEELLQQAFQENKTGAPFSIYHHSEKDHLNSFDLSHQNPVSIQDNLIEDIRHKNLLALSKVFNFVNLCVRHEMENKIDPHKDGGYRIRNQNLRKIFMGSPMMRILCTRKGEGTLVSESGFWDPWQVETGDYLFIPTEGGLPGKAIYHSPPSFVIPIGSKRGLLMCMNPTIYTLPTLFLYKCFFSLKHQN